MPAPSQAFGATQGGTELRSGCPAAMNVVQVPAAFAHDMHGVEQASAQQVPSTQKPEEQSGASAQGEPLGSWITSDLPLLKTPFVTTQRRKGPLATEEGTVALASVALHAVTAA